MALKIKWTLAVAVALAMIAVSAVIPRESSVGAQEGEAFEGERVESGQVYQLKNVDNGRYLDADRADNNFNVETSAVPRLDDEWMVIANGDGTFLLRNEDTGRYLDGDGGNQRFNVDQSVEPGKDDRWIFEPVGDGSWFVVSALLGRYLDADGADKNYNVDTSSTPRRDDQWELIKVGGPVEPPPPPPPPAPRDPSAPTYTIEFTNITTGQYLTPPNYVAHDAAADVFEVGAKASAGVQAVAENGGVPVLAAELAAGVDANGLGTSGVGRGEDGPIGPGQSRVFEVRSDQAVLSIVSMIICTNDGFAGLDSVALPTLDGGSSGYLLNGYDAGTERNTELRADLVPAPFCGPGDGAGESNPALAENGVISAHPTLTGAGDLATSLDWEGAVASVIVTRNDPIPTYTVTIDNIASGQYLTPPNYAVHSAAADVFQLGQPASAGVQAVAENGGVPVLAAELAGALDATGLGVSGVGGGADGPIGPNTSRTFTVRGTGDRLSIVSMIVCTNDGFAGVDSQLLPSAPGDSVTFESAGYDAGTERNTEDRGDLVPAPFCGPGDGSGVSDPALAEGGVIRPHQTLRGTGNLDPALDWDGNIMRVTVTRNADEGAAVIANRASGDLSVINADTLLVDSLALPDGAEPMYVNHWRLGGKVFVGDRGNDQVIVLDDETMRVIDTVPAGAGVFHQWIESSGSQLWVVGDIANVITVIDPATLDQLATIPIPADIVAAGGKPHDVFVSGRQAFVTIIGTPAGIVLRYDTSTFDLTHRIDTAGDPHLFVLGGDVYVPQQNGSVLSLFAASDLSGMDEITVPLTHGIWVTRQGQVLTTNIGSRGTNGIFLLDGSLSSVLDTVDLSVPTPHNLAVSGSESRLFVTHSGAAASAVSIVGLDGDVFGDVVTRDVGTNPFGLGLVQ